MASPWIAYSTKLARDRHDDVKGHGVTWRHEISFRRQSNMRSNKKVGASRTTRWLSKSVVELGVSKEDVVLAYQPPCKRAYTAFAVV
jgi:hypothetical protein